MKKILKVFSFVVISLFVLSLFGWMSYHISKGDKKFGFFTEPVKFMYTFPDMFSKSVEEVKKRVLPNTFIKTPDNFKPINKLNSDLIALISYSDTNNTRTVVLKNLKNDSVLHTWTIDKDIPEHHRIWNPLLLPGKSLVYHYKGVGLTRIDSMSNVIWDQKEIWPHHSVNLDSDGDIWVCTWAPVHHATGYYKLNNRSVFFKDEYITKVDSETGEVLFNKSIAEILSESNRTNHLLKSGNIWDPIHINDIQPAFKTTDYYNEGDVFISSKNLSAILHYRPATNELIDIIEGPFTTQHDVDFYDDNSLVFFNNNHYPVSNNNYKPAPKDSVHLVFTDDLYSQIVRYNFENESFSFIDDSVFKANKIFSVTEGLVEFFEDDAYFVEEQNPGILWVIKDDEVIYKNIHKSIHDGFHDLPNWTRIIKNYE